MQFGLATLLLTLGAPLLGVISFKRLGIIQKFPERYHSSLKWLHKRVSNAACTVPEIHSGPNAFVVAFIAWAESGLNPRFDRRLGQGPGSLRC